jgi:serine/threonine-protein kinase RIO1
MKTPAALGLIRGDLSEFNGLVGLEGPVIIDLPQAVIAAGNNGALAMLARDVNNIRGTLGRFAPEPPETEFAREMWALFELGELTADSKLAGVFARDGGRLTPMGSCWSLRMRARKRCNESSDEKASARSWCQPIQSRRLETTKASSLNQRPPCFCSTRWVASRYAPLVTTASSRSSSIWLT